MNEKQTRQSIIDERLLKSGWDINDHTQVIEEFSVNTLHYTSMFSDYVLLGRDGKPLAVVEAKKSSKDAEIGREQAKQYCENIV